MTLEQAGSEVIIAVDDDGPGIPADKIEEVFEPFTRIETSRSLETGGSASASPPPRSIVRAHGGEITLVNRQAAG